MGAPRTEKVDNRTENIVGAYCTVIVPRMVGWMAQW